jgi:hypothetical protein
MSLQTQLDVTTGPPWQDYVVLGGKRTPGFAVPRGAGSPRKWDRQAGYGLSGAVLYYLGEDLTSFEVDVYCWEAAHFAAWDTFAKAVLSPPAPVRVPASLSIQHPALNGPPLNIDQVVVEDVSQWEQEDDGLWVRSIKLIRYRKPKPALVKPLEGPPGDPTKVETPTDPELATIAENSRRIAELAK